MKSHSCSHDSMDRQPYDVLAVYYDHFQEEEDFTAVCELISRYRTADTVDVADLGCGTGTLSLILAGMGLRVWAVDRSAEMLRVAEQKRSGSPDFYGDGQGKEPAVLNFLRQDLNQLNLPSEPQLIVAVTDTLNHLPPDELTHVLDLIYEQIAPGGIFIFDLLKLDFLRDERGEQTFFSELSSVRSGNPPIDHEAEGHSESYLVWQNHWDEEQKKASSDLVIYDLSSVDPTDNGDVKVAYSDDDMIGAKSLPSRHEQIIEYYHPTDQFLDPPEHQWMCLEFRELPERLIFVWRKNTA